MRRMFVRVVAVRPDVLNDVNTTPESTGVATAVRKPTGPRDSTQAVIDNQTDAQNQLALFKAQIVIENG